MVSPMVIASGGLSAVFLIVGIVFFTETIYSYSAGYWALFATILFGAVAKRKTEEDGSGSQLVGIVMILSMVFASVAFVASLVHAAQPFAEGMDVNYVAPFAFFVMIGSGLVAHDNMKKSNREKHEQKAGAVVTKSDIENGSEAEVSKSCVSSCQSCCSSCCWVLFAFLIILSGINIALLSKETSDLFQGEDTLVQVGDHHIFTRCSGAGEPTVFFSHGLGGNSLDFSHVQREVAEYTRVCSYDRAGYGRSTMRGPMKRVSDRLSDEEYEVLQALEIDQAIFVGHSFAGFNLRALESKHPEMFLGLVLVDAVNPNTTNVCVEQEEKSKFFLYYFGMYVQPSGVLRLLDLFGLLNGFAPFDELPEDVQSEYKSNVMKNEYYRTRNDEFDYWSTSCAFVGSLEGEEKLLDFPVTHILPLNGIYQNQIEKASELADLSPDGEVIVLEDPEISHNSILFAGPDSVPVAEAVRDMFLQVTNATETSN